MSRKKRNTQTNQRMETKERYHGPLITQGVHLAYIKSAPIISFLFSLFMFAISVYNDSFGFFKLIFAVCAFINILGILLSFFNKLILRYQFATYIFLGINLFVLLFNLMFLGLLLFIAAGSTQIRLYSLSSLAYLLGNSILFIVMVFVYVYFYRRDRLTNGSYREKEKKFNSWDNKGAEKFWITLAAVSIIPPLLTGYLANAFGFVLGVAVTVTFTAVVVDCFYAAAYARKHPELEED